MCGKSTVLMFSEDITFCANSNCENIECYRNPKRIKLNIPHAYALFSQCEKWSDDGAKWLTDQIKEE